MDYRAKTGRIVAGVEVRVVDEDGTVLPNDGEAVGEFEVRGPWVTGSYYRDEDPAKFHDGWLRTGDMGSIDDQGYMNISDRTKDVIKSGGEWISSVELENKVMAHPDVFEAAVIAVPDAKWSERPLVAVVPKPGAARAGGPRRVPRRPRGALVAARAVDVHRARCPRPRSASSTRRSCAPRTPTANTRCRPRHCQSERPERGNGAHGRTARGGPRGAG